MNDSIHSYPFENNFIVTTDAFTHAFDAALSLGTLGRTQNNTTIQQIVKSTTASIRKENICYCLGNEILPIHVYLVVKSELLTNILKDHNSLLICKKVHPTQMQVHHSEFL